jgi:hypothetical protein
MSTLSQETVFRLAVSAAEATRQNSIAVAFAAYGYSQAGYATYIAAVASAQATYATSVAIAASTAALDPELGRTLIATNWAKIAGN